MSAFYAIMALAASHQVGLSTPTDPNPLPVDEVSRPIRRELDGSGVSNLASVGNALLVVDPNEGLIHAYELSSFGQPGRKCRMIRQFAPWRTVSPGTGDGVKLVSEDEQTTIDIRGGDIAAWTPEASEGAVPCPSGRKYNPATDSAPRFRRVGDPRGRTLMAAVPNPFAVAQPAVVRAGARGQVLDVKPIGQLSGSRFAVLWKELDQWPVEGGPRGLAYGRVLVNVWVSIFNNRGRLLHNLRIEDHELPQDESRTFAGLSKRAFEYLAAVTDRGVDWLYVVDGRAEGQTLRRFRLPGPSQSAAASSIRATATVRLFPGALPEPSQDPPTRASATVSPSTVELPVETIPDDWTKAVLNRVQAFSTEPWHYPKAALTQPCGKFEAGASNDQCEVTVDSDGNLVPLASGAPRLSNQEGQPARWIGPRHLIGATEDVEQRGLPYSYGGVDDVATFRARLHPAVATGMLPPIGNIRETLSLRGSSAPIDKYPLGLDCSAFVAAVFGVDAIGTRDMMSSDRIGPSKVDPWPVPHLSLIRPGDVLVKKGHVVIFTRVVPIGRPTLRESSFGYEVYEATSRCGRVCRSVYEPDFFNGWWIVRMPALFDGHGRPVMKNPNAFPPPPPSVPR